jgi:hypothetical protein
MVVPGLIVVTSVREVVESVRFGYFQVLLVGKDQLFAGVA